MWLRRLRRAQRGSQIVEFALIGPILVYLVLCVPVFGMFVRSWIVISAAARDGARAGAVLTEGSREGRATEEAERGVYLPRSASGAGTAYFDPARDIAVTVGSETITVAVTYHQPSYLPLLGALLGRSGPTMGDTVPLTARATFWLEKGRTLE